jgi:hypothetical protein
MKQEVIQDFLTVPGIAGIALIDGLSRPYFHGFGANFDPLQQEAIAQGIQQVLETTPEGFNSFEFQFDFYRIYLHKLKRGITLLVLTGNTLPQPTYTQAVRRVLLELQLDQENPVATFQSIAATIPLVWQPTLRKLEPKPESSPLQSPSPAASLPYATPQTPAPRPQPSPPKNQPPKRSKEPPEIMQVVPAPQPTPPPSAPPHARPPIQHPTSPPITFPQDRIKPSTVPPVPASGTASDQNLSSDADLKDVLAAINALSQLTTQYLGTLVVANYWKATRPAIDWLNYFQIERSTQMTFSVQNPSQPLPRLTAEQHKWLQEWVAAFIARCSKVIRDFGKIVRQVLTEQQRAVLFHPPYSGD